MFVFFFGVVGTVVRYTSPLVGRLRCVPSTLQLCLFGSIPCCMRSASGRTNHMFEKGVLSDIFALLNQKRDVCVVQDCLGGGEGGRRPPAKTDFIWFSEPRLRETTLMKSEVVVLFRIGLGVVLCEVCYSFEIAGGGFAYEHSETLYRLSETLYGKCCIQVVYIR